MYKNNNRAQVVPTPEGVTVEGIIARRDELVAFFGKAKCFTKETLVVNSKEVYKVVINTKNSDGIDLVHQFGTDNAKLMTNEVMFNLLTGSYYA
jgi:hypothetical protein